MLSAEAKQYIIKVRREQASGQAVAIDDRARRNREEGGSRNE